jgi:hypothetical protein
MNEIGTLFVSQTARKNQCTPLARNRKKSKLMMGEGYQGVTCPVNWFERAGAGGAQSLLVISQLTQEVVGKKNNLLMQYHACMHHQSSLPNSDIKGPAQHERSLREGSGDLQRQQRLGMLQWL